MTTWNYTHRNLEIACSEFSRKMFGPQSCWKIWGRDPLHCNSNLVSGGYALTEGYNRYYLSSSIRETHWKSLNFDVIFKPIHLETAKKTASRPLNLWREANITYGLNSWISSDWLLQMAKNLCHYSCFTSFMWHNKVLTKSISHLIFPFLINWRHSLIFLFKKCK